jgi:hypothetical protein
MPIEVKMLKKKWKLVSIIQEDFYEKLHFDIKISQLKNDIKILWLMKKKRKLLKKSII